MIVSEDMGFKHPKYMTNIDMDYVQVVVRKDGTLTYRLRKKDKYGKERSKYIDPPEGLSEKAFKRWISDQRYEFINAIDTGDYTASSKTPLSEYFDKDFVRKKKLVARERTVLDYQKLFNGHIRDRIGDRPLEKLTAIDVREYYQDLKDDGAKPPTIQHVHVLLRAILNSAIEDEILVRNVVAGKGVAPRKPMPHGTALTEDDVVRILDCLESEPELWRNLMTFMIHTGCRRGEVAGLRWEDVDLEKGVVHIRHSLITITGKGVKLEDTKSEMSNRLLPLFGDDIDFLKDMHRLNGDGYVFSFNGNPEHPVHPDSISKYVRDFRTKYDLPKFTPHTLRRTFPTLMITMFKTDPKTMQTMLGHSNISTTLGYYTVASPEVLRGAVDMYGKAIREHRKNSFSEQIESEEEDEDGE